MKYVRLGVRSASGTDASAEERGEADGLIAGTISVGLSTTFGAIGGERSSGEASMYARIDELGVSTVLEDGACAWGGRDPAEAAGESSVAAADVGGLEDVGWDREEVRGRSYMSVCTNNQ